MTSTGPRPGHPTEAELAANPFRIGAAFHCVQHDRQSIQCVDAERRVHAKRSVEARYQRRQGIDRWLLFAQFEARGLGTDLLATPPDTPLIDACAPRVPSRNSRFACTGSPVREVHSAHVLTRDEMARRAAVQQLARITQRGTRPAHEAQEPRRRCADEAPEQAQGQRRHHRIADPFVPASGCVAGEPGCSDTTDEHQMRETDQWIVDLDRWARIQRR